MELLSKQMLAVVKDLKFKQRQVPTWQLKVKTKIILIN